ncbi:MAG: tetratricopeptide repeat protein, partial [Chloroflexota bacterium]|nr:tetratricopeptide repeat protein [Chloroflexota bacterium]
MSEMLLQTKLTPPLSHQKMVTRLQVQARLNEGLIQAQCFSRKLSLVSAPAGYGKTSLAIDWLRNLKIPFAWISLDEDDNDPSRFLVYLITALRQVNEEVGASSQAMLAAPRRPPFETILTVLINEINTMGEPLILVLDDYHTIQAPPIHQQVSFLMEHQPDCLHQVILSREDPPLSLPSLRARRQVLEIRQDDLRFSLAETTDFLARVTGIKLDGQDIAALNRRTEGWIAGLQLAALSLRTHPDGHAFVDNFTGSNRYVLDYLFEEVFQGQPPEVQSFLLNTSILTRLTPPLCDALTGRSDGRAQLEALDKANLFILPLDEARRWYRYQHLFADLLRHLLRMSSEPPEATLHQRASRWYQGNGLPAEAVRHALAAADWEQAATLIQASDDDLLKRGEVATLLSWFAKLPEEVIQSQPALCLSYAWSLMLASQFEAAEAALQWAEHSAHGEDATMGEIAAARAYLAQNLGDGAKLIEMSHKALAMLPEDDQTARGIVALNLGIAYWHAGRMDEAQEALEEAYPACRQTGNTYGEMAALVFLGRTLAVRGQLRQAAAMLEEIVRQAGKMPVFPLVYLDLCVLHYEWNELEAASRYLVKFLEASQRMGNLEFQIAGYMQQARLRLASGDASGAIEALEQMRDLEQRGDLPERTLTRSTDMRVQVALWLGDMDTVEQLAPQLLPEIDAHNFYRYLGLTRARIWLATGRRDEAA